MYFSQYHSPGHTIDVSGSSDFCNFPLLVLDSLVVVLDNQNTNRCRALPLQRKLKLFLYCGVFLVATMSTPSGLKPKKYGYKAENAKHIEFLFNSHLPTV